jgi:hypothetical protein
VSALEAVVVGVEVEVVVVVEVVIVVVIVVVVVVVVVARARAHARTRRHERAIAPVVDLLLLTVHLLGMAPAIPTEGEGSVCSVDVFYFLSVPISTFRSIGPTMPAPPLLFLSSTSAHLRFWRLVEFRILVL